MMKKVIAGVFVGLAILVAWAHRSGDEEEMAYEGCYGQRITNGPYAEAMGKPCVFVLMCPTAPPSTRQVRGVPIAEYDDALVFESRGMQYVWQKAFIESFTCEEP